MNRINLMEEMNMDDKYILIGSASKITSKDDNNDKNHKTELILESYKPINIYNTVPLSDESSSEKRNNPEYYYYFIVGNEGAPNIDKLYKSDKEEKYTLKVTGQHCSLIDAEKINRYLFVSKQKKNKTEKEIYKILEYDNSYLWSKRIIKFHILLFFFIILLAPILDKVDWPRASIFLIVYSFMLEALLSFPKLDIIVAVSSSILFAGWCLYMVLIIKGIEELDPDMTSNITNVLTVLLIIFQLIKLFHSDALFEKRWKKAWHERKDSVMTTGLIVEKTNGIEKYSKNETVKC